MSEKIQNSFYKLKEKITDMYRSKVRDIVIDEYFLHKTLIKKGFKLQEVKQDLSSNFSIKLYYKKSTPVVKWKEFIATIAKEGEAILQDRNSKNESYIILLLSNKTKRYYATTGGYAHITIQEYAESDFGIEILSRIVTAEDKALRSTKERSLTGGIQGAIKFFRNDYNLHDNENFGNIYNELNALLDINKLINIFGFNPHELKSNSLCVAKNSFTIKKTITFEKALEIITICEDLINNKPRLVEVNSVQKVNKYDSVLISNLNSQLEDSIYDNYLDSNAFFSVEISHKDFEKYNAANVVEFKMGSKVLETFEAPIRDIQEILEVLRLFELNVSREKFDSFLNNSRIRATDTDGNLLTDAVLRDYFCSEITYKNKSYFLIEREWYQIQTSFIDKINELAKYHILNNKYSGPVLKPWNSSFSTENDYNASFIGSTATLVFDKFTPQNIEACDILKWDSNSIYFYHVKKGFDNSMRDLCNQVYISSRRVFEDSKNNYTYLKSLYDSVKNSTGMSPYQVSARSQFSKMTKKQFIGLFDGRKIVFVLCVLDTAKTKRSMEKDISKFDSNIAKFTLNELSKNMQNLGVEFQILQLSK